MKLPDSLVDGNHINTPSEKYLTSFPEGVIFANQAQ